MMNKTLKLKYGLSGVGKDDIWPKQNENKNENTAPLKETSPLENYVSAQEALLNKGNFAFSENEWLKNVKDGIKNHDDFSYDVNSDALYQQLVDQYVQQGKMASADVMGKAAGMTGGYGNSYANTVGNQVYQSYLQQLNNEVPALYESALNQHNMQKQALYDEYALLMKEYDREYGLYADEYNRLLKSLEGAKELEDDNNSLEDENVDVLNGVRNSIITKAESFSYNAQLSDYISALVNHGELTPEQGDALFEKYRQGEEDFKDRTWTKVEGDNGVFIGKLNDNAKVKDEYGNEYRLDELVEKLMKQGMTKEKAIEFAAKYNK